MDYKTSGEIEFALVRYFGRQNYVIVPNLSYGLFPYEMDLCALNNRSLYATEIEIKISKSDLKRDSKKWHNHDRNYNMIRYLYFAMPDFLKDSIEYVPERAGVYLVDESGNVTIERKAVANKLAKKWDYRNAYKLGRLGTIRMWNALETLEMLKRKNNSSNSEVE